MANTFTANYNMVKPEVGAATNQWGGLINSNLDTIDTQIKARETAITNVTTTANAALARAGGTMTGFITLHANPSSNYHPATKLYCDTTFMPVAGGAFGGLVTLHAQPTDASADLAISTVKYVKDKVSQAEIAAGAGLPATGGSMTGYLTLNANPVNNLHAATKQYVDTGDAAVTAIANAALSRTGGTMTGAIVLSGNPTADLQAAPKQYVDTFVPRSGNVTMTGQLILSGDPANANGAATKNYVDANFMGRNGNQTMGGYLTLFADPTSGLHAATKQYVDNYSVAKTGGSFSGNVTIPNLTISGSSVTATGATISCFALVASSDITLSSDFRIKEDIRTIENAVDITKQLRGVSYVRKDTGKLGIGVVAQEVEQVLPQLVATDANGMKSVAYANMVGILIEAVKELSARVAELEAR
jgi:hypothetical protein